VSKWEGPLATLTLPSSTGGPNWPGGSLDPATNILYIYSFTQVNAIGLINDPKKSDMAFISGRAQPPPSEAAAAAPGGQSAASSTSSSSGPANTSAAASGASTASSPGAPTTAASSPPAAAAPALTAAGAPVAAGGGEGGGEGRLTVQGLPLIKPPWGRISAIDLNKGELVWQVAHGETPDFVKNHPALKGLTIPRTGQTAGRIGTLTTATLVLAGDPAFTTTPSGQRGAMMRAYDKATGAEVGAVFMPAPQTGSPMTYLTNGRQYIVVAIAGANYSAELLAFRLPKEK
jgi:quinoprotein glucose dehydrogenase